MITGIKHSEWLKADLHIHSHASNKTKENDYDGSNLTFDSLIDALSPTLENSVDL